LIVLGAAHEGPFSLEVPLGVKDVPVIGVRAAQPAEHDVAALLRAVEARHLIAKDADGRDRARVSFDYAAVVDPLFVLGGTVAGAGFNLKIGRVDIDLD